MRSIDIANLFVTRHGSNLRLTNLTLNKLVYFAQVESLRSLGKPLFSDSVEAWEYGPVEPAVYYAYKSYGRSVITSPVDCDVVEDCVHLDAERADAERIVDTVAQKYGSLLAFDLVEISHRKGGAWRNNYVPDRNVEITTEDIIASSDYNSDPDMRKTLLAGIRSARENWPNTLQMLEDS